jgi:hypothetical protein
VISNPCFELWGIYHFVDHHAPIATAACLEKLRQFVPHYTERAKYFQLSEIAQSRAEQLAILENAIGRGRKGVQRRAEEGEPHGCPSSNCYELVEKMRQHQQVRGAQALEQDRQKARDRRGGGFKR